MKARQPPMYQNPPATKIHTIQQYHTPRQPGTHEPKFSYDDCMPTLCPRYTSILDIDNDDEDDNPPPHQPAPALDTHVTTATEANTDHETDPKLFSVFNPGHSGITSKEKRNIKKNETDNDFKGDVMQHQDHETFRLFFDNQNVFNLTSKGVA
jgi:hypothetical protein